MAKIKKEHQIFINEYLTNGLNGTKAYQKAYPKASSETARANASKLLTSTNISEEIKKQTKETLDNNKISLEYEVIRQYIVIATTNTSLIIPKINKMEDIDKLSDDEKICIKSVKTTKKFYRKKVYKDIFIEFHDKLKAIEMLAKYMKIIENNEKLDITYNIPNGTLEYVNYLMNCKDDELKSEKEKFENEEVKEDE